MGAAVVESWDSALFPVTPDPQIQQQTEPRNREKKVYLKGTSIILWWSSYQSLLEKFVSVIVKLF